MTINPPLKKEASTYSTDYQVNLILLFQSGDQRAFERLVSDNKKLVHKQAKHYISHSSYESFKEDIYNAGVTGLYIAAKRYQPQRGLRFSSCAVPIIRTEMRDVFCAHTGIKRTHSTRLSDVSRVREEYLKKYGCPPSLEEVARIIGTTEDLLRQTLQVYKIANAFSIDKPRSCQAVESWADALPSSGHSSNDLYLDLSLLKEAGQLSDIEFRVIQMIDQGFTKQRIRETQSLSRKKFSAIWKSIQRTLSPIHQHYRISCNRNLPQRKDFKTQKLATFVRGNQ